MQQLLMQGEDAVQELSLRVQPVTEDALLALEKCGLLRRLLPPASVQAAPEGAVEVECVYASRSQSGSHMLICVGFNKSKVELATHPDNEEFILVNEGRPQKPLVLIVGLHGEAEFQRRASAGLLTPDDIWALELKFSDPRLSFFTMHAFTPHCEWTPPGPGPASVFWVTEPSALEVRPIDMSGYTVNVELPSQRAAG